MISSNHRSPLHNHFIHPWLCACVGETDDDRCNQYHCNVQQVLNILLTPHIHVSRNNETPPHQTLNRKFAGLTPSFLVGGVVNRRFNIHPPHHCDITTIFIPVFLFAALYFQGTPLEDQLIIGLTLVQQLLNQHQQLLRNRLVQAKSKVRVEKVLTEYQERRIEKRGECHKLETPILPQ